MKEDWITSGPVAQPGHDSGLVHLPAGSGFAVTIAAVNRFVTTGLEGYFCGFAALGTGGGEHLTPGTGAGTAVTFGFSGLTTLRAPFGLVSVAFGLEKLLVFSAERKSSAAIRTRKGFVLETHWTASSLKILVRVWSSNT